MMNFLALLKRNRNFLMIFILIVILCISLIFSIFHFHGTKYSFRYYISGTQNTVFETRSVPAVKNVSKVKGYVEEFLLGPSVQRAVPAFPLKTRILFCFERQGILFLNLSQDAILDLSPETNLRGNYELLEMNVKSNFPHIKKIELFVDGISVFSDKKNE